MTRINTNVGSLIGRNNLSRANANLSQSLTRLSTGLRINTGADDPAGLIASENLRSDITSIRRAIGNTERANQVIATADSALGQVSSLLNDIRGLVTESANSGALSDEQIAANQLQIDSSLEALNQIAQTTTFQGRKLLDGSLDFTTTAGANFNRVSNLQIDQANLGASGSVAIDVAISAVATQAQVDVAGVPDATAASQATATIDATNTAVAGVRTVTVNSQTFTITGDGGSEDFPNNITSITLAVGGAGDSAVYDSGTGALTVTVDEASGVADIDDIIGAINTDLGASVTAASGAGATTITTAQAAAATDVLTTTGRQAGDADIVVTSTVAGTAPNGTTITLTEDAAIGTGSPTAVYDQGANNITVTVDDSETVSLADITSAIDGLQDFTAALTVNSGDGNYNATTGTAGSAGTDNINAAAAFAGGAVATGGITQDVVFELSGQDGSQVFSVRAGTSVSELASQINLVSDATGVVANTVTATGVGTNTLELTSTAYGTDAFVNLEVLSEGALTVPNGTFTDAVSGGSRQTGTDIVAKINGIDATGDANNLTINTATLDLSVDIAAGFIGNVGFTVTGGGALFQLGPDVVSNQQARIGIGSVNTAQLGGVSGQLFELGTGGSAALATDPTSAANIVEEAINQVTSLRGRLGAFQRTTLETNKNALNDTLTNLSEAESAVRDADFAVETAELTRSQILVQSGTRVLAIANQNPQNVLALLG